MTTRGVSIQSTSMQPEISIVIPTKNASGYLSELLTALQQQNTDAPLELILLDSRSSDGTLEKARVQWPDVRTESIDTFSHGGTRNRGVHLARGHLVVFMTQDALPAGPDWLHQLITPLQEDHNVAVAYSRQIPYPSVSRIEALHIADQFPDVPPRTTRGTQGVAPSAEACFCSNASAAYRRECLLAYPFSTELIMGEDQQAARDLLQAGFSVTYASDSRILHSHAYTFSQNFRRYFDSAVASRDMFPSPAAQSHNQKAFVKYLNRIGRLIREHPFLFPLVLWDSLVKSIAITLGHHYKRLPRSLCKTLSMHPYYWTDKKELDLNPKHTPSAD